MSVQYSPYATYESVNALGQIIAEHHKTIIHGAYHAVNDSLVHFLNTLTKELMCIRENCMLNRNMEIHI